MQAHRKQKSSPREKSHLVALSSKTLISTLICSLFLLSNTKLRSETHPKKIKIIAITEIVPHASLEEAKAGILAQLKAEGFEAGKNLQVIEENAHGNIATANLIAKKFVGIKGIDLIIPISTPSALAVRGAARGTSIPIVFSSVSDPVGAGLIADLNKPDPQITGAVDTAAVVETQSLLKTLFPKAKRLGVLYNAGEANSVKTLAALKSSLDPTLTLVERSVPNSNLVADGLRALIGKVDAIYIPSDNTVFSALPKLIQITREHKIPTITNDPDSVKLGILVCYGYSQFAVGQTAGSVAAKVLRGEGVGQLKVRSPEKAEVLVNAKTAKILGLEVPGAFQTHKISLID